MLDKKAPTPITSAKCYRKELDDLYARRFALDALIQSLEEYDRFRAKSISESKRKTA